MTKIKDILIWLGVFIVGSLIVSFLIYPESFDSFKENINSKFSNIKLKSTINTTRLVPSEMDEYDFWAQWYKSCAGVESIGESAGISNPKQKTCREACGKRNMKYSSYSCEKDLFVCYCIDN